jgi:hypothetical protein
MAMFVKGSCAAIVATFGAAIAGAAIYKEEPGPAATAAYAR